MEWVIQADERSGFRHPVSLDDGISQSIPKRLGLFWECGPSGDKGPEFPAEPPVDPAESPPAAEKMVLVCRSEVLPKLFDSPAALLLAFHLALQRLNETGNRDENGDPLPPDRVHEFCGPERIDEYHRAS